MVGGSDTAASSTGPAPLALWSLTGGAYPFLTRHTHNRSVVAPIRSATQGDRGLPFAAPRLRGQPPSPEVPMGVKARLKKIEQELEKLKADATDRASRAKGPAAKKPAAKKSAAKKSAPKPRTGKQTTKKPATKRS